MFKRAGVWLIGLYAHADSHRPGLVGRPALKTKTNGSACPVVEGELVSLDVKKLTAVVKTDKGNQTVSLAKDVKRRLGRRDGVRTDLASKTMQSRPRAKVRVTMRDWRQDAERHQDSGGLSHYGAPPPHQGGSQGRFDNQDN